MKRCVRTWCLVGAWVVPVLVGMESLAQEKTKKESRAALPPHVKEVITAEQEKLARKIMEQYEPLCRVKQLVHDKVHLLRGDQNIVKTTLLSLVSEYHRFGAHRAPPQQITVNIISSL